MQSNAIKGIIETHVGLAKPLVEIDNLHVHFALKRGAFSRGPAAVVRAVDGVSLSLEQGEVLGIIGESGSGKSTLGRAIAGLAPVTDGEIRLRGTRVSGLSRNAMRPHRRHIQFVFQDPHASLNPTMTIGAAIAHPLQIQNGKSYRDNLAAVEKVMRRVGLAPPERFINKYPSELSGGQKQRAVIARAIIGGPSLLIADEPISMLDMSVRAKILSLMIELKNELDLTYVYITHDLSSARYFCDRIAIMYMGRIVEQGTALQIFNNPKHPYTKALVAAMPHQDGHQREPLIRGDVADAAKLPGGCAFHPRCPVAFSPCGWQAEDFNALIERWCTDTDRDFESIIGSISQRGSVVDVSFRNETEATSLFDKLQAETRGDPIWTSLVNKEAQGSTVSLRLAKASDPAESAFTAGFVRCHLHDNRFSTIQPTEKVFR